MPDMLVTLLTSQAEILSLNVFLFKNRLDMSVTSEVHQLLMGHPHV
jgi:hypothetical protein